MSYVRTIGRRTAPKFSPKDVKRARRQKKQKTLLSFVRRYLVQKLRKDRTRVMKVCVRISILGPCFGNRFHFQYGNHVHSTQDPRFNPHQLATTPHFPCGFLHFHSHRPHHSFGFTISPTLFSITYNTINPSPKTTQHKHKPTRLAYSNETIFK